MSTIDAVLDRARVIATSAVTYISAAIVVLQFILAQDVVADIPNAAQYISQAVAFLAGVIAIIRRVTPVPKEERGVV